MKKRSIVIPPRRGIEPPEKTNHPKERKEIAAATEQFLKAGGQITRVPTGKSSFE